MAFYAPFNRQVISNEALVAPGAVIQAQGQALVRVPGSTSAGVMPSVAADDTEIFVGFAIANTSASAFPEAFTNKVEEFVVPSTGIVKVQFAPISGQTFIRNKATGAAITGFTVTGNSISGMSSSSGVDIEVTYKYALTVVQRVALYGNEQPGGYAGDYVGQIGVVKAGVIYISEFDASKNWNAATAIKLAPNGQITDQSGTGAVINAIVISAPTQNVPYLGIEFSAPAITA